jgi:hypothetical protein
MSGETGIDVTAAATALGRLGGKVGGPARARKLNQEERKEIAKLGCLARWADHNTFSASI